PFQFAMLQRKLDAIVAESSADSALDPNSDAPARFQPSHDTRPRQFSNLQARANRAGLDLPRQKGNLRKRKLFEPVHDTLCSRLHAPNAPRPSQFRLRRGQNPQVLRVRKSPLSSKPFRSDM